MEQLTQWLLQTGLNEKTAEAAARVIAFLLMIVVAYVANFLAKKLLLRAIRKLVERTKTVWDDMLVKRKVFNRLSHLAPALEPMAALAVTEAPVPTAPLPPTVVPIKMAAPTTEERREGATARPTARALPAPACPSCSSRCSWLIGFVGEEGTYCCTNGLPVRYLKKKTSPGSRVTSSDAVFPPVDVRATVSMAPVW